MIWSSEEVLRAERIAPPSQCACLSVPLSTPFSHAIVNFPIYLVMECGINSELVIRMESYTALG